MRDLQERAHELSLMLTPKEFGFCIDYLKHTGTLVDAYRKNYSRSRKQGRTPSGKSKANNADYVAARKVLDNPNVAEYISVMRALSTTETTLSLQEKREALAKLVRLDWSSLTDSSGNLDLSKVRKHSAVIVRAVKKSIGRHGTKEEIELSSALEAIRLDNELAGHNKPVQHDATPALVDAIFKLIPSSTGLNTPQK